MGNIVFTFNPQKAIESIIYLAKRISEPELYDICKLLYVVDKLSLERYGRFVSGESYAALKEGATPSNTYNLLKSIDDNPIEGIKMRGTRIIALREANMDYLSESDVECLNRIIDEYGNAPYWVRGAIAHDKAWKDNWNQRGEKDSAPIPLESIAELLKDSDDLLDYLSNGDAA